MRLGILASHPIQYQAPLFRHLARSADLQVFFAHKQDAEGQADAGFGVSFEWDVDLLSGYSHSFLANRASVPSVSQFMGCDVPNIKGEIDQGAFDAFVVMGWHLKAYWQAVAACRRCHVPVLVRGDSQLGTPRSFAKRAAKAVGYRMLLRAFDGFLYVGKKNRVYLRHYGVPESKLFFSPHCIDTEWFRVQAREADRHQVRQEWGMSSETKVLLFVGKLISKKRPMDVLEAARHLHEAGLEVGVTYVGDGPMGEGIRTKAESAGFPVHFAGFKNQTELPACYAGADILILPSDGGETWGLVVNEAMACGIPAVISDAVGCAPDLIVEGVTGRTFPIGDATALARAVKELFPWLGTKSCQTALEERMRKYSLEQAVKGILEAAETLSTRSSNAFVYSR